MIRPSGLSSAAMRSAALKSGLKVFSLAASESQSAATQQMAFFLTLALLSSSLQASQIYDDFWPHQFMIVVASLFCTALVGHQ